MELFVHGNPYAINKVTVNGTEYQPKAIFGRKHYSHIECKKGDDIRLYHDPNRQWVLHSENEEDDDRVHIWKNSRMTGTLLPESDNIRFIVPSDAANDAIFDVISNEGKDNEGYDNIYAAWSIGWAKQVIENRINAVTL